MIKQVTEGKRMVTMGGDFNWHGSPGMQEEVGETWGAKGTGITKTTENLCHRD